jgi:sulfate adenylyltransferase small subunit
MENGTIKNASINKSNMLPEHKLKTLIDLIKTSSNEELIWINGYLSGIIAHSAPKQETAAAKNGVNKITIVYGTETGNSKKLATNFAATAKKNGIHAKVVSMDQYRVNDLSKEEYFFSIVSTHGEGDPPEAAKKFYDHIHQNGFQLGKLKYGVLALGDTSYPLFCKTGEDVDVQLQKLGGNRIVPLQKCDVDFEDDANTWINHALKVLQNNGTAALSTIPAVAKKSTGRKTYTGIVLSNISRNALQTYTLLDTIEEFQFDVCIGGARRDEEKARAKERIFSVRDEFGQWNPKLQRPELWNTYNGKIHKGENVRAFPISNWTELDIWNYIRRENIDLPSIYFAHEREVIEHQGQLVAVSDFIQLEPSDNVVKKRVRYRTVGDMTCTAAVESNAFSIDDIIIEIIATKTSERGETRIDDQVSEAAMEDRKKSGYF